jgi:hemolysin III
VLYGLGKKVPYMHAVWHLFVLAGSVLHTLSVFTVII